MVRLVIDNEILMNWQTIPAVFKLADLKKCYPKGYTKSIPHLHDECIRLIQYGFIKIYKPRVDKTEISRKYSKILFSIADFNLEQYFKDNYIDNTTPKPDI